MKIVIDIEEDRTTGKVRIKISAADLATDKEEHIAKRVVETVNAALRTVPGTRTVPGSDDVNRIIPLGQG